VQILLVDDNLTVQRSVRETLKTIGVEITVTHSGPSALLLAKRQKPKLILVDFSLEGMNVFAFAQRVLRECEDVPIVVLMGPADECHADRLKSAGIGAALRKPIRSEDLIEAIRLWLPGVNGEVNPSRTAMEGTVCLPVDVPSPPVLNAPPSPEPIFSPVPGAPSVVSDPSSVPAVAEEIQRILSEQLKTLLTPDWVRTVLKEVAREIVLPIAEAEVIKEIKRLSPDTDTTG